MGIDIAAYRCRIGSFRCRGVHAAAHACPYKHQAHVENREFQYKPRRENKHIKTLQCILSSFVRVPKSTKKKSRLFRQMYKKYLKNISKSTNHEKCAQQRKEGNPTVSILLDS